MRKDLQDYILYCSVTDDFQKFYDVEDLTKRELDRALWQMGKDLKSINYL